MCLKIKKYENIDDAIRIADKDIECYKILRVRKDGLFNLKKYYYTPFQYKEVKFPLWKPFTIRNYYDTHNIYNTFPEMMMADTYIDDDNVHVSDSVVHSYVDEISAYVGLLNLLMFSDYYTIHKAIIPKGTEYVISADGREYGSRLLKVYRKTLK